MKKKLISLLLTATMVLTAVGCGKTAESGAEEKNRQDASQEQAENTEGQTDSVLKDGKNTTITMVFPGNNSAPGSLEKVEEAMTEIARKTIDCTVELKILEWGVYTEQTNLMRSSGEDVDIMLLMGGVQSSANSGQIRDISNLVGDYAGETEDFLGEYLDACYVGDALYGFPCYRQFATKTGLVCLTSILEETGVDPETVKTWDDVDKLLAEVQKLHPELDLLIPADAGSGVLRYCMSGDFDVLLSNMAGVYADGREGLKAENIYASDEFMDVAKMAYEWNQKGYFIADSTTITDTRQTFLKAGSCFGYIGQIHPGTATQESINAGVDVTTIPITEAITGTANVNTVQYCIPTGSDCPEKALAFLNLVYTNPEIQNLLHFGIEGEDYVVKEDGVAGYPDGIDSSNVGWSNEVWLCGNASIGYVWETDPATIWDDYKKFNEDALMSCAYGFTFDTANVKTAITAVQNVLDKYTALICSGESDPEKAVAEFNRELETAGMPVILEEMQSQLDAFEESK